MNVSKNNLIKQSDITFHKKSILQQNRKTKLNKLQQDLLQYYKEIINHTDISSQLREIQLAIERETRLFAKQKVTLFNLVNEKYQKSIQQEIINNINEKINKESNIVKLQVDIKDEIDDDNNLTFQQKHELHNIHNEKIRNLHGGHYDKMIQLNVSLNKGQKKELQDLRKQCLILLINKNYDSLLNEIQQSKDIERLKDDARRSQLDFLISENENQIYNSLLTKIQQSKDIERLKDDDQVRRSQLDSLYGNDENQSYDLLLELIHNTINKIEYEYLTNERTKSILQELLNKRIQYLQQLEEVPKRLQTKHPIEEVESNNSTTNPDKADQEHNLAGTVDQQITYIINQYRKILSAEDQKKYFPCTKTKTVLGKDDSFLFEKNYKATKINEMKNIINNLNNYLYEEPRKKAMISKERLQKHKKLENYKNIQ
ncbi:21444_t:CDS:2 [Cetraspora pellucida]|uniref:21444_t:CDS:1 n=1 Tax=Cetraspora pellucida TaxID=1433469 RepID=A0A9N9G5M4_9GLOM|nr:21444_t:CDS:2 [Cetraspora pellucida]